MDIRMPTRGSVIIEHNGNTARFYGELCSHFFLANTTNIEWLHNTGSIMAGEKEDLILAALEYCKENDNMRICFYDSDKNEVLKLVTRYWESQGLCPNCGGTYIGFFKKRCKSCGVSFFARNFWHIILAFGFIFSLGLLLYFLEIFFWFVPCTVAFIVCYSAIVLIFRKYPRHREND